MKITVSATTKEAGELAAIQSAKILNEAIKEKGFARILLSTGASQFAFFDAIVKQDVDWSKVEMFHLDEYVGIPETHPASFQKYLKERFVNKVNLKKAYLINGGNNPQDTINNLEKILNEYPIDLGLIGIGENGHIAFNDPPADFEDNRAYKIVTLDEKCCQQQIREGWFKSMDDVYKQAISMTCKQIMKCKTIISLVPYSVKSEAIFNTLTQDLTPKVPATLLKTHKSFYLYCDKDSAKLVPEEIILKIS